MHPSPRELHIPDGFLTPVVSLVGWALAIIVLVIAVRQTRRQLAERQVPVMGVMAAFIFAAQAVNFPVAAGTSGHLLGGALASIALGPWAGALMMTSVIVVQGLVFQDGGLMAMGWNIVNMGILTAFSGRLVYDVVRRMAGPGGAGRLSGAIAGAWVSVEIGAIATAIELAVSGTTPLFLALPAMAGVHALIGLGEALITVGAVALLQTSRPQVLLAGESAPGKKTASIVVIGLAAALVVAMFSPLASSSPDGLEAVAGAQGFLGQAQEPLLRILPDYTLPLVRNPALTVLLSVGLGTIVVFGVAILLGRIASKRGAIRE
jgi:cobalt/nickel transport system permease protein